MSNISSVVKCPEEGDEKPRTLFVGNIPSDASKYEIESIFGEIGPLKRLHFQYPKYFHQSHPEPIVGYVTFALPEDAASAVSNKSGYSLRGNKLSVKLSKSRSLDTQPGLPKPPRFGHGIQPQEQDLPKPKPPRQKTVKKKARLIIRNLSFQVTEDNLKEHFSPYGDVRDINILKKHNGKLVGCAFIQFDKVSHAAKALRDLNLKPFLERPIAIDWALPKTKFQEADKDVKKESEVDDKSVLENVVTIKEEPESDTEQPTSAKKGRKRTTIRNDSESDDSDDDTKRPATKIEANELTETKPRVLNSNDADEGKTFFIRNLNFDTTSNKVKEFFQEFGPVNYAVICKDHLTEHSKGTAFVKFWTEDAFAKCLQRYEEDPTHFVLDDRQFYVAQAMSKSRLTEKLTPATVQKEPKDKRNLYLVREGFVRPGTSAAEGMSPGDVAIRATLHHHKRQMLKDLNNFISDKRLCIHNLPEKYTDKQLRSLVVKHGGAGAKVVEARIMRDKNTIAPDGFKSKGFGFVTFTEHVHALAALRALNNNPQTFTKNRRPVVEFSLEKRAALKIKAKRMERSRENLKSNNIELKGNKKESKRKRVAEKNLEADAEESSNSKKKVKKSIENEEVVPDFGGLASKPGLSTIPSLKPKGQGAKGKKGLKLTKVKVKKMLPRRKREKKSHPAKNKGRDEDRFEKQLSAYKQKNYDDEPSISKGATMKKKKWYA